MNQSLSLSLSLCVYIYIYIHVCLPCPELAGCTSHSPRPPRSDSETCTVSFQNFMFVFAAQTLAI